MVCHINCRSITDGRQLHLLLARYLEFPQWYGRNLDALYDCLTELPEPLQLHLSRWDSNAPWAPGFEAVLQDAQEACPELTVFFNN